MNGNDNSPRELNAPLTGLRDRWNAPAGYREVLRLAVPLVLTTGSWSIQHFVDRMFLCWYTPAAMAAAMPAGMLAFTIISLFMGTAAYANTFVAQYHGAGRPTRVGPAVWQAIYFAAIALVCLPAVGLAGERVFQWVGHEPAVRDLEARYFRVVMIGAGFTVYNSAVSSYFTGLGRNWPIMWINVGVTVINLSTDYLLIFGNFGFPEMGIEGAAWATNIANAAGAVVTTVLLFSPGNQRLHSTRSGWRFDRELFSRLLRFGLPSGTQFMLDILAFALFTFVVGRLGTDQLAATNLGFQINTIAFLPMIGFGIATSTLVGQWLGRDRPDLAARATWSSFHLTFVYMATIAVFYVLTPRIFIAPFAARVDPAVFDEISEMAQTILIFVAVYSVFDTMNVIFAGALKGAGDTRFVMYFSVVMSWSVMVVPAWLVCEVGGGGIYAAWTILSIYILVLGFGFLARFLQGRWRDMRVIERPIVAPVAVNLPETPTAEVDL